MAMPKLRFHERLAGTSHEIKEPTRRRCNSQPDYALCYLPPILASSLAILATIAKCLRITISEPTKISDPQRISRSRREQTIPTLVAISAKEHLPPDLEGE